MTLEDALNAKVPAPNATAWVPGLGTVGAYIDPKTGKTQNELPVGSVVTPYGSSRSWEITGGTAGNYTSKLVENSAPSATGGITSGGGGITSAGTQTVEDMYGKALNDMTVGQNNLTRMAVNQLESQKKGVHGAFDASARNAYTNYMMNNKDLNEVLIRAGLSEGGMSESSQVASNAAYGAELTANEIGRNQAISDIDSQIADVRYKGEAAILDAKNSLNLDRIEYLTDKEEKAQDRAWAVEDINRSRAWANEDRADTNYHAYQKDALGTLQEYAQMGITNPPKELLNALGLTPEQYKQMLKYYKEK